MKTGKQSKQPAPNATSPAAGAVRGADILVQSLEREGVEVTFAYPGGASLEVHQALTRSKKIRVILPRHEQGGAFAAGGYARASGKAGVCMATSGPGATNLISGIADAYMDSVPLVAITGQVASSLIGKMAFQETDILGITLPIVKHSYLVMDVNDIPRIIKEAFHIANTGRPGPVLVDLPKNVQQAFTIPSFPKNVDLPGYPPIPQSPPSEIEEVAKLICKAKRPVFYCGGGIISSNASNELRRFVLKTGIPVATTLMGIGCFPENHPLSLKWLGMHGAVYANNAVNEADLVITLGARFDDRVTGNVEKFAEHATIVHIDIDPSEINKNKRISLPVISDVRHALISLNHAMPASRCKPLRSQFAAWHNQIDQWRRKTPLSWTRNSKEIQPQEVISLLSQMTRGDAIITTGVGQHQMFTAQFYQFHKPRSFLTSGGLGAMGFGYPAALGAKVACPDKQVIDVDGDGSFLMNIQELATAHIDKIAAKAVVLNNRHLGMVVQWEDRFYKGNRGNTFLADPRHPDIEYPNLVDIANGFNVPAIKVMRRSELRPALETMLKAKTPFLVDVRVSWTEHVLPMIPPMRTYKDVIVE
ncbi:MAG: biosynthetic-type acetolactate synthase large subunit [Verrucomicrobiae bacterium]|nr:biosynthetic-type acetolactate synthase large subunit [Verrucomicrobiae bacterium]